MLKVLEIYNSFNPEQLLEVKFVQVFSDEVHYDPITREYGYTETNRTFRTPQGHFYQEKFGNIEDKTNI